MKIFVLPSPLLIAVALAPAAPLAAQDTPRKVDLAVVQADLDHVFERPPGRVDPALVQERFTAFWKKYEGLDLGRLSYARGLSRFWSRDVDGAVQEFDRYLEKFGADGITNREQRMTIGRSYLGAAVRLSRAEKIDEARYLAAAANFARCYDEIRSVVQHVTRGLGEDRKELAGKARVAMARVVLDRKLPAAEADGILAAIYGEAAPPRRAAAPATPRPTTIAPFTATAMSGKEIDLRAYRGRVVLVDFWATWCGPCLREMPNVVKCHEEFHQRGFDVIGISLDKPDAEAKIAATTEQLGMKWEQVYDGGYWQAKLAVANGIRSIPAAFLVDRKGEVRFANSDARGENLRKNIALLLAEK